MDDSLESTGTKLNCVVFVTSDGCSHRFALKDVKEKILEQLTANTDVRISVDERTVMITTCLFNIVSGK